MGPPRSERSERTPTGSLNTQGGLHWAVFRSRSDINAPASDKSSIFLGSLPLVTPRSNPWPVPLRRGDGLGRTLTPFTVS
jgi:hypothetical protein